MALRALEVTGYNTKAATLVALVALGCSAGEALDLLERHDGFLDASQARIASKNNTQN